MPARTDISSILIIGSGPIVIGQACEFDYSGVQACRILRQEGYRVILANSNPATIMTDPGFADATYVEPLVPEIIAAIIAKEKPDALLPTLGGQTALNLAKDLTDQGVLEQHGVELIGANMEAIATAEDRDLFKRAMSEIGLKSPPSGIAHTAQEADVLLESLGLPVIIRPAYILGGKGATIAATPEEFKAAVVNGLAASPISEILIETSIAGWKEFELEVMRDKADNCVVVCSIENFDPMGVHTGDSITVAPVQTLSDAEYQVMRNAAFACMRRVGVETGGSNVQFAVNPQDGTQVIIEMNPRVSRSSALASKATGFPIAKIAARLAVGYTLDEIQNDITQATPACFEPSIDYVVTKIPRWAFEKFPGTRPTLGAAMQSVGEVMALGRTFAESMQKAIRSLEQGRFGLNCDPGEQRWQNLTEEELLARLSEPTPDRIFEVEAALQRGIAPETINQACGIDLWFLDQLETITAERKQLSSFSSASLPAEGWRSALRHGFCDAQLAWLWGEELDAVSAARKASGIKPTFKTVDTCAAEFEAHTPYHYSTYEDSDEVVASPKDKVMILGAGPNRIGQGIEFDYCCVHAAMALREAGYETIMVNCNPETVSTDYDTSDRLYFEPLSSQDVLEVIEVERRVAEAAAQLGGRASSVVGIIIGLGGQTPLKLAHDLPEELIAGTKPNSIDMAEDRERWSALCRQIGIPQPPSNTATTLEQALSAAAEIGYPLLVRPSYVLGGRAMVIAHNSDQLREAFEEIADSLSREGALSSDRPILLDKFLEDATEVDVDAVRDHAGQVLIGGVMEHVEEAGVHSGDSACVLPPRNLSQPCLSTLVDYTHKIAHALDVIGPLNVQYVVTGRPEKVLVIEANPRASRTVPFVAKATGVPLAKIAARVMLGATLEELRQEGLLAGLLPPDLQHVAVKEAVLPFNRFPESDTLLGPEMRSTGEVMGIDKTFGMAFLKSQLAAGTNLPKEGNVLFVLPADKFIPLAQEFAELGFQVWLATDNKGISGELEVLSYEAAAERISEIQLAVIPEQLNTSASKLRIQASNNNIPLLTTYAATQAALEAIKQSQAQTLGVRPLQLYNP